MATLSVRRAVCLFRKHDWRVEFNRETQGTEADCARCGAHKSTYPGGTGGNKRDPFEGWNDIHTGGGPGGPG
jgi:hypothetical protein